jgi:hypothetical protein
MELVWADKLTPGSLMVDDLIMVDDELIEIINIGSDSTGDNYFIDCVDVYGEPNTITIAHDSYVNLYVYVDSDE